MKSIILYNISKPHDHIYKGGRAMVYPINHTSRWVVNNEVVTTSMVLNVDNGVFETHNSIYVPIRMDTAKPLANILGEASNAITPFPAFIDTETDHL